jgi:hypothetical protein
MKTIHLFHMLKNWNIFLVCLVLACDFLPCVLQSKTACQVLFDAYSIDTTEARNHLFSVRHPQSVIKIEDIFVYGQVEGFTSHRILF